MYQSEGLLKVTWDKAQGMAVAAFFVSLLLVVAAFLYTLLGLDTSQAVDYIDVYFEDPAFEIPLSVSLTDNAWFDAIGPQKNYIKVITNFSNHDSCFTSIRNAKNTTTCRREDLRRLWLADPISLPQLWDCNGQRCFVNVTLPERDENCIRLSQASMRIDPSFIDCNLPQLTTRTFDLIQTPALSRVILWKPVLFDIIDDYRTYINGKEYSRHFTTTRLEIVNPNGYHGIFYLAIDNTISYTTL
ncbi:hypothetical protein DSO57_1010494 [Entomophthora muscae]|uniref:Uncharacterized protein n=1 Tax=Entomophthora muscae TaxID=34485 RepID=A0ACC2SJQ6_9FUNG|nr:hypothetical protein DSO57_1010494 [Entomophthora muscae]